MGQNNTEKAALRFDQSNRPDTGVTEYSKVSNCVIHDAGAWGISVMWSRNINVTNTDVFSTKQVGIVIDVVTNVNFDGVNVFDVQKKASSGNADLADKEACVAHCSWSEHTPCFKTSFTNSIVAGCPFAGVIAHGHSCKDPVGASTTNILKNIVAHSVYGTGVAALPDVGTYDDCKKCYQMSYIMAYKND